MYPSSMGCVRPTDPGSLCRPHISHHLQHPLTSTSCVRAIQLQRNGRLANHFVLFCVHRNLSTFSWWHLIFPFQYLIHEPVPFSTSQRHKIDVLLLYFNTFPLRNLRCRALSKHLRHRCNSEPLLIIVELDEFTVVQSSGEIRIHSPIEVWSSRQASHGLRHLRAYAFLTRSMRNAVRDKGSCGEVERLKFRLFDESGLYEVVDEARVFRVVF